MKGLAVNRIY